MQRSLIALSLVMAPIALAVALLAAGASPEQPAWWSASVALAILGGVTIMIYGINIHSVPEHSGRQWASLGLIATQIGAGVIGAWLVFFGRGYRIDAMEITGHLLATIGAVLFMANIGLLFRQPGPSRPSKVPRDQRTNQQRVDRLAIPFTIISGLMSIAGTGLGLVLSVWTPRFGRWDLVWAHVLLLGFFFSMASGTSYHMLSRWTGRPWRSIRLVQVHLYAYLVSFPLMVIALAWDIERLFFIAGPLMAVAMMAWAGNILPMATHTPGQVRVGIVVAMAFLAIGVAFGVMFAVDPGTGPRLRGAHVSANLYGFAGLLISGFGYGFIPRIAGTSGLRWPSLAPLQIAIMSVGSLGSMVSMGMWMYGNASADLVRLSCTVASLGMVLFAIQVFGSFWLDSPETSERASSASSTAIQQPGH